VLLLGVSVLQGDAELIQIAGIALALGALAFAGALVLVLGHLRARGRIQCGGNRARAYALGGDPLAEDPGCAHEPSGGSCAA